MRLLDLPTEILIGILLRLDIRELARILCVSTVVNELALLAIVRHFQNLLRPSSEREINDFAWTLLVQIEQFNCTSPYAAPEGTICANIGGFIPTLSDKYYSEDESEPPTSLPKRTLTFYMSDLLSSQDEWLKRHGLENDGKYPYIRAVFVEQVGFRVVLGFSKRIGLEVVDRIPFGQFQFTPGTDWQTEVLSSKPEIGFGPPKPVQLVAEQIFTPRHFNGDRSKNDTKNMRLKLQMEFWGERSPGIYAFRLFDSFLEWNFSVSR